MSLANHFSMMVLLLCFIKEPVPVAHMTHLYDSFRISHAALFILYESTCEPKKVFEGFAYIEANSETGISNADYGRAVAKMG